MTVDINSLNSEKKSLNCEKNYKIETQDSEKNVKIARCKKKITLQLPFLLD